MLLEVSPGVACRPTSVWLCVEVSYVAVSMPGVLIACSSPFLSLEPYLLSSNPLLVLSPKALVETTSGTNGIDLGSDMHDTERICTSFA